MKANEQGDTLPPSVFGYKIPGWGAALRDLTLFPTLCTERAKQNMTLGQRGAAAVQRRPRVGAIQRESNYRGLNLPETGQARGCGLRMVPSLVLFSSVEILCSGAGNKLANGNEKFPGQINFPNHECILMLDLFPASIEGKRRQVASSGIYGLSCNFIFSTIRHGVCRGQLRRQPAVVAAPPSCRDLGHRVQKRSLCQRAPCLRWVRHCAR